MQFEDRFDPHSPASDSLSARLHAQIMESATSCGPESTIWTDGTKRINYADSSGHAHAGFDYHPIAGGGFRLHHWGSSSNNFELTRSADGSYELNECGRHHKFSDNAEFRHERERLIDFAISTMNDEGQIGKFIADMIRFEGRLCEHNGSLTVADIKSTYSQLERLLLTPAGKSAIDFKSRQQLGCEVLAQAAVPTLVDQGSHNTCTVAAIESLIYRTHPDQAAKLVTDIALTGLFIAPDGSMYQPDFRSVATKDQESIRFPHPDGDRSYASQIFQIAAVNIHYAKNEYEYQDKNGRAVHCPPGSVVYVQVKPCWPSDTGERLVDISKNPPVEIRMPAESVDFGERTVITAPSLELGHILEVADIIIGGNETKLLAYASESNKENDESSLLFFSTETQLRERLKLLSHSKMVPVVFLVHTGQEPFWTDSGQGAAGGYGNWHAVTITGFDEQSDLVSLDNQWGSSVDHIRGSGISVHDLFLASRDPLTIDFSTSSLVERSPFLTIEDLRRDVQWARSHPPVDLYRELELLRMRRSVGELSENHLANELAHISAESKDDWDGRSRQKFANMIDSLTAAARLSVLKTQLSQGPLDATAFDGALIQAVVDFRKDPYSYTETQSFESQLKAILNALPKPRRAELEKAIARSAGTSVDVDELL